MRSKKYLAAVIAIAAAAAIVMIIIFTQGKADDFGNVVVNDYGYEKGPYAELSVTLDKETVTKGDTVTAVISLNRNPGIIGIKFHVKYNEDILEVVNEPDLTDPQLYTHHVTDSGLLSGFTDLDNRSPLKSGFVLRWSEGAVRVNDTDVGQLAAVEFRVKEDAPSGVYGDVVSLDFVFGSNDTITYLGTEIDSYGYPEIIVLGAEAAYVEYGNVGLSIS